jgi:tRNA splicing endonuclease
MKSFMAILTLILIGCTLVAEDVHRQKIFSKLAQEYEDAKESLRQNPKDIRLREAVLKAGRKYYATYRLYSQNEREEMLRNDLYVIIAGSNP